jgi:hypothetical protein
MYESDMQLFSYSSIVMDMRSDIKFIPLFQHLLGLSKEELNPTEPILEFVGYS